MRFSLVGCCLAAALLAPNLWSAPAAQAAVIDVGSHSGIYTGLTRGFFFTAPTDLAIVGLDLPLDASRDPFDIAVLRFSGAPAEYPWRATNFTVEYLARNQTGPLTGLSLAFSAGEVIGVLGSRGENAANSYAAATSADVLGTTVSLTRLVMQSSLHDTSPLDAFVAADSGSALGRVLVDVEAPAAVPAPAAGLLLLSGLGGFAIIRRRHGGGPLRR